MHFAYPGVMSTTLLTSFRRAGRGIVLAFRTEQNIRRHTAVALFVFALCFIAPIQVWQAVAIIIVMAFVFVVELVNTSIERFMNMVKPQFSDAARDVKDIAAGAVLIAALASVCTGLIIFGPYALFLIRHV